MVRVVRSARALDDLEQLWRYIAEDNPRAADGLLYRIHDAIEALKLHPERGVLRTNLGGEIRLWPVPPYNVYYRYRAPQLVVLRIIHGRRNITPGVIGTGA